MSCPSNSKDTETVLINAHGIIALDEFQKAKELATLLKATTTGAAIKRRILYTTSKEQTTHPDAVPFLTVNDDVWCDEATQKRFLRITMGQPSMSTGGWRGDFLIRRDWVEGRIRERAWTELVFALGRVHAAAGPCEKSRTGGLARQPSHERLLEFRWAIAEQEGADVLQGLQDTMTAVDETQTAATEFSDDLLELLTGRAWPCKKRRS